MSEDSFVRNSKSCRQHREDLDEEEKEFRALRRDLPGVKGASAAGIVAISVGKAPGKNEFFRSHPEFRAIVPMVNVEMGMEKHYFAVAPTWWSRWRPSASRSPIMRSTSPSPRAVRCGSFQYVKPTPTVSRTNTIAPKKSPCCRRATSGCGCTPTWRTGATKFFTAPADRFAEPQWPDLEARQDLPLGLPRQESTDRQPGAHPIPEMGCP